MASWGGVIPKYQAKFQGLSRIFKASRARGFVLRSLELQNPQASFSFEAMVMDIQEKDKNRSQIELNPSSEERKDARKRTSNV
ncbi:hypothetical protein Tco_0744271 [Tanacetum coccineum]